MKRLVLLGLLVSGLASSACSTPALSPKAHDVVATRNAPGGGCQSLEYLVGKGGGTFGGGWVANEDLVEYAMNDLRNKGADLGANYIQTDPPMMGSGSGTTTTVTISGTAYRCPN